MCERHGTTTVTPVIEYCLIVDDSERFLEAAKRLLERQGLRVVAVASNGVDAVRLAQELKPDVVLLDVHLGADSGFDVLRRLRDDESAPPVILISTQSEQDYRDLIAASPAAGFLPKTHLSAGAIRKLLDRS
jgi:DNA-binding NarL/FixJ family response regulator